MTDKELRELDLELPPCQTITLKDWNEGKVSLRKNLIAEFERPLKEEIQSLESSLDIKEAELSQSRFSKALDIDKARQEAREILQKEFDVKSEQLRKEVRKECISLSSKETLAKELKKLYEIYDNADILSNVSGSGYIRAAKIRELMYDLEKQIRELDRLTDSVSSTGLCEQSEERSVKEKKK